MNSMLDIAMYCQDKLVLLKDFYLQLTFSPIKIKKMMKMRNEKGRSYYNSQA